jgi:cyanate permease
VGGALRLGKAGAVAPPVPARLLLLAIVLVALNLRSTLASLPPPLVHTIQADLGLSSAAAGLLTTFRCHAWACLLRSRSGWCT